MEKTEIEELVATTISKTLETLEKVSDEAVAKEKLEKDKKEVKDKLLKNTETKGSLTLSDIDKERLTKIAQRLKK